ncbi:hypothetical protein [Streptomyces sp. bgisy027]|uniref:hypothetical protein n=1 Tax=Streptomyces sp. bgisy027 TaxID=3413770 RepID=UPI003D754DAA
MTSSLIRGRSRRGRSHISVRVAHAVVGGLVGVVWLVLPGMTISGGGTVAGGPDRPVAGAREQGESAGNAQDGESSATDLVLPVAVLVAAGLLASFGFMRRRRRARDRTTPSGAQVRAAEPPTAELDERARAALVEADDSVRVSAEELAFVVGRFGVGDAEHVEPFTRVLREARGELAVAFRMRWQYEGGVPDEPAARRHALAGIVGRCEEVGRLLDGQAAAFDQSRGLEEGLGGGLGHALVVAEGRFRELTWRTGGAGTVLSELGERYAASATAAVAGHVEQAKDRLVFATTQLNHARQAADSGDNERAGGRLRAAEGAIAQAAVFIDGIERLAGELSTAAAMVPAALTGSEVEIAGARDPAGAAYLDIPAGELRSRVAHADATLAGVREELASGRRYDPLDLLRRIVRGVGPVVAGRAGVLPAAAVVCARSAVGGADDVVATHRAAVGGEARTLLAEARRLLAPPVPAPAGRGPRAELADLVSADALGRQAHHLAEQDVRLHGHPGDGASHDISGLTGAVLGGILLPADGPPPSFGGPRTRARRPSTAA